MTPIQYLVVALYTIVLLEILGILGWGTWNLLKTLKKLFAWTMKEINIRINIIIE